MGIVVLGHLRAAIELALVLVVAFLRPTRIVLAGFLHVGRHCSSRACDLPLFRNYYRGSPSPDSASHFSDGSLRHGSPRGRAVNRAVTRITRPAPACL